ncbi:hypothetical protein BZG36_05297, partial [Bifiguratus adelaidae]
MQRVRFLLGSRACLQRARLRTTLLRDTEATRCVSSRYLRTSQARLKFFHQNYDYQPDYKDALSQSFQYSEEVQSALAEGRPVVALESTIISHGMAYPHNAQTANAVEDIIRSNGCVPATIAIMDGKVNIGLTPEHLEKLGEMGAKSHKTSRRDLAVVMAHKWTGSTTVSASMILAHRAGIKVFVTGGIGGVHRGAEQSMDVSADLYELGRTPIAVVCAGAKSILDIEKTLEVLETQGVTVATYGSTKAFPAFYTPESGYESPFNVSDPDTAARIIEANARLQLNSGLVFAVPIPTEDAAEAQGIQDAIDQSLREARQQQIRGKDETPFLLKRVSELTGGKSLASNIALVRNNARIGSDIAKSLAKLTGRRPFSNLSRPLEDNDKAAKLLVIGGVAVDVTATIQASDLPTTLQSPSAPNTSSYLYTSTPGSIKQSIGGVGRNMAQAAQQCGQTTCLASVVGDDDFGKRVTQALHEAGMDISDIKTIPHQRTAVYNAIHGPHGDLIAAVADMDIFSHLSPSMVCTAIKQIKPSLVAFDGNIASETMISIGKTCRALNIPAFFEPTSVPKSIKAMHPALLQTEALQFASPNEYELMAMVDAAPLAIHSLGTDLQIDLPEYPSRYLDAAVALSTCIPTLFLKLGAWGCLLVTRSKASVRCKYFPVDVLSESKVVSVTGAGDSFVGTVLANLLGQREPLEADLDARLGILSSAVLKGQAAA